MDNTTTKNDMLRSEEPAPRPRDDTLYPHLWGVEYVGVPMVRAGQVVPGKMEPEVTVNNERWVLDPAHVTDHARRYWSKESAERYADEPGFMLLPPAASPVPGCRCCPVGKAPAVAPAPSDLPSPTPPEV